MESLETVVPFPTATIVSEAAHIKGEAPKAARYDDEQTAEQRRSHENLILLCKIHHKVVDDDPKSFPVQRLIEMKAEHEATATTLPAEEIEAATNFFEQSDIAITAANNSNSVIANVYQHNVHNYAMPGSIQPDTPTFQAKAAEDGQGRFRSPGTKIGMSVPFDPYGLKKLKPAPIHFNRGPVLWFRLIPTNPLQKDLTFADLDRVTSAGAGFPLRTICHRAEFSLTSPDGVGRYLELSGKNVADSLTFLFKTGEIWSVESLCFSNYTGRTQFAYSLVESELPNSLIDFSSILARLGIDAPYRWEAGVEQVEGIDLVHDLPRDTISLIRPKFRADHVKAEGLFSTGDAPRAVLAPFFTKLFAECGKVRPSYLGQD